MPQRLPALVISCGLATLMGCTNEAPPEPAPAPAPPAPAPTKAKNAPNERGPMNEAQTPQSL